jgi:hypothetical protein
MISSQIVMTVGPMIVRTREASVGSEVTDSVGIHARSLGGPDQLLCAAPDQSHSEGRERPPIYPHTIPERGKGHPHPPSR